MYDREAPQLTTNIMLYPNEQFHDRRIDRGGTQKWPPRSPDLSPLDFHVWSYKKNMVHERKLDTEINYFSEFSMLQDVLIPLHFLVKLHFHSLMCQDVHLSWQGPFWTVIKLSERNKLNKSQMKLHFKHPYHTH
jgi:hypothetical protein